MLRRLAAVDRPEGVHFLNEPSVILCALIRSALSRNWPGQRSLKTTLLFSPAAIWLHFDELAELFLPAEEGKWAS